MAAQLLVIGLTVLLRFLTQKNLIRNSQTALFWGLQLFFKRFYYPQSIFFMSLYYKNPTGGHIKTAAELLQPRRSEWRASAGLHCHCCLDTTAFSRKKKKSNKKKKAGFDEFSAVIKRKASVPQRIKPSTKAKTGDWLRSKSAGARRVTQLVIMLFNKPGPSNDQLELFALFCQVSKRLKTAKQQFKDEFKRMKKKICAYK